MAPKLIFALALLATLLSCSETDTRPARALGGASYGGELRFMSPEKITDLFPLSSEDVYEQRITTQIFETLVKMDKSGTRVIPSLAESYTLNAENRTFTLKIRKGVYFHDNTCFPGGKGRELQAEDVKYSLQFACSGLPENKTGNLLVNKIRGGKKFYAATHNSIEDQQVSGIEVVDDQTVKITLEEAFTGFDRMLTHPNLAIFPKEAYEEYGNQVRMHPVGTGPFMLAGWDANGIRLERNPHYWKKDAHGNQLPFLDKITMTYSKSKKDELLAFRKEKIDLILEIPADEIDNALGTLKEAQAGKNIKHKVDSKNSMSVNYFGFANGSGPFNDVRVRKAFNLALDRNELVMHYLKGEGYPMVNGFVPTISGYPSAQVKGFPFDPAKARELLAQAGFPGGAGFPKLDIYVNTNTGSSTHMLVEGIRRQLLQHLNIALDIRLCSLKEREAAIRSGKAKIWKSGWLADYPDAENFLNLFYSGENSPGNPFHFSDAGFNAMLEEAMREKDPARRTELLLRCDQMVVDRAVVIPIFNDDFITMINAKMRNFETNSMEILDFSTIFIKEPKR